MAKKSWMLRSIQFVLNELRYMISLAVALVSCWACHVSTCRRIGSKFLCMRSTPTEMGILGADITCSVERSQGSLRLLAD